MANEPSQVEGPYETHDYTVADGATIEKYTMCKVADPRTASAATGAAEAFAGIAATEKVASNSKTELGLWTTGTFVMTSCATIGGEGVITAGSLVVMSGANQIRKAIAAELLTGAVVGRAKEAIAAATTGEVTLSGFGG